MANEFVVKDGLIISGSWYNSASIYGPNLDIVTSSVDYYITWRQSDGRLEVTPAQGLNLNTQGCWIYSPTSPTTGSWSDLGAGLSLNPYIWLHQEDGSGVDQAPFLNGLGTGSIVILNIANQNLRYVVRSGPTYSASLFGFELNALEDYPSFPTGSTLCLAFGGTIPTPTPYYNTFIFTSSSLEGKSGFGNFAKFSGGSPNVPVISGAPPYVFMNLNTIDNQGNDASYQHLSINSPITILYTDPSTNTTYKVNTTGCTPNFNPQASTLLYNGILVFDATTPNAWEIKEGEVFSVGLGHW